MEFGIVTTRRGAFRHDTIVWIVPREHDPLARRTLRTSWGAQRWAMNTIRQHLTPTSAHADVERAARPVHLEKTTQGSGDARAH